MPRVTIIISDKQPQPYRFPLDRDTVTLGRGSDNDIIIKSESVSVHHAKMYRVPGGYELRDLGSTNGLKLEDERKIFVALQSGMTVRIGEADFSFQLSAEELEELGKETPVMKEPEREEEPEEEEIEKEERPKKKAKKSKSTDDEPSAEPERRERRPAAEPDGHPTSSVAGKVVIVLFLILAALAFFVGLSIRFQKETGGSLIDSVLSRPSTSETPAAKPETPEPTEKSTEEAEEVADEEADDGFGFAD